MQPTYEQWELGFLQDTHIDQELVFWLLTLKGAMVITGIALQSFATLAFWYAAVLRSEVSIDMLVRFDDEWSSKDE